MEKVPTLSGEAAAVFSDSESGTKRIDQASSGSSGLRYSLETQAFDFCRLFSRLSLIRGRALKPRK